MTWTKTQTKRHPSVRQLPLRSKVKTRKCHEPVIRADLLTWKANCPEKSYMPQECIRLRVFLTASGLSTRSPEIGQMPPFARVAAMTLALSQVTSMEHSWRFTQKDNLYHVSITSVHGGSHVTAAEWKHGGGGRGEKRGEDGASQCSGGGGDKNTLILLPG